MNTNKFYVDDMEKIDPKRIGEEHLPVLFLLDTSGSMQGEGIRNLQASVNRFKDDMNKNPKAADLVEICVMGFNGEPYLIQNWRPVSDMNSVQLTATGGTNITAALNGAIDKIRERLYEEKDVTFKVPWIILISDGYGGDVTEIGKIMKHRSDTKRTKLWFLGAPGYDKETAAKLTFGERVFEMKEEAGYDFTQFFDFITNSLVGISTSAPNARVHVDDPTKDPDATMRVPDLDAWLND